MNEPARLLPHLRLSQPCPKRWEELQGGGDSRYCEHCDLYVHNLSAMTEEQAEAFLRADGGRKCVYFRRRADGRILTAGASQLAAGLLLAGAAVASGCQDGPEPAHHRDRPERAVNPERELRLRELGYWAPCEVPGNPAAPGGTTDAGGAAETGR